MKPAIDIHRLSRGEQLELLDQLWETLGREATEFPLTDDQRQDLDQRLDELEREGPSGVSWDDALVQIRS
jgi:putative addiction module component (TIGR02574 family)